MNLRNKANQFLLTSAIAGSILVGIIIHNDEPGISEPPLISPNSEDVVAQPSLGSLAKEPRNGEALDSFAKELRNGEATFDSQELEDLFAPAEPMSDVERSSDLFSEIVDLLDSCLPNDADGPPSILDYMLIIVGGEELHLFEATSQYRGEVLHWFFFERSTLVIPENPSARRATESHTGPRTTPESSNTRLAQIVRSLSNVLGWIDCAEAV